MQMQIENRHARTLAALIALVAHEALFSSRRGAYVVPGYPANGDEAGYTEALVFRAGTGEIAVDTVERVWSAVLQGGVDA